MEIIDVPLSQRLRARPPKPAAKVKRKRKRRRAGEAEDEDEDEDEEDDEDDDDGDEDDVSEYSADDGEAQRGGGRGVSAGEVAALRAVLGSHLSLPNCQQLIKKAGYDVNAAVNLYYAQMQGEEVEQTPAAAGRGGGGRGRSSAVSAASSSSPSSLSSFSPQSVSSFFGRNAGLRSSVASTSSSSSSSPSSFPPVVKPAAAVQERKGAASSDESDFDSDGPRRRRPAARRRGRALPTKLNRKGKKGGIDPNVPPANLASRPSEHSLAAAQRMSTYEAGMEVDAKVLGKWSADGRTHAALSRSRLLPLP